MKISLTNMHFFAYHGYFPEERKNGNRFLVNLTVELPACAACQTDALEDTLNYQQLYDIVKREMEIPSNLLEHVAARIRAAIGRQFPQITHVSVSVAKRQPPLGGQVEWAGVELG